MAAASPAASVTATFRQQGVAVENPFTRFSGKISYDAKNVATATAVIEVETASLDIGDPGYNAEVAKKSWFDSATPLRSGWALGQQYLEQAAAVLDVPLGKGRVVLSGPEIVWRAQPHGTFKLLFNSLLGLGAD